jgi:two-component system OmpR family response regulator
LRRKLEADPTAPSVIVTERGVGYTFSLPVELF